MDINKLSRIVDSVSSYHSESDRYFSGKAGRTTEVKPRGFAKKRYGPFGPEKEWCFEYKANGDYNLKFFDTEEEMNQYISKHWAHPVKDSSQTDYQAEDLITKDKIWELYEDGTLTVPVPKKTNLKELIKSLKERIQEMWGDEEVNFTYEPKDFEVIPQGDGTLAIEIVDSVCKIQLNV